MSNPFSQEFVTRQRQIPLITKYGISFLDEALGGIFPTDLIVLGAATGVGKTHMALQIAVSVASTTRRVKFYALEADPFEIERRIKYNAIADYFFKNRDKFPKEVYLNQPDWRSGKFDSFLLEIDKGLNERLEKLNSDLKVFTPQVSDFTKQDFSEMYKEDCLDGYGLIILDHLHYLWHETQNEYQEIKTAVASIRDLINTKEVPIIMISHLRKPDRFSSSYVPSYHDLHGSSEISKRANAVITFSSAREVPNPDDPKNPKYVPMGSTFVRICKARDGKPGCTNFLALMKFDRDKKNYSTFYKPYDTNLWGSDIAEVPSDKFLPWMKSAHWELPNG